MNIKKFNKKMSILSLVMVMILVFGSISFAGVFDPNNNNGNGWGSDIYNHLHVITETESGLEIVSVNYVIENEDNYVEMDKNDKNNPDVGARVFSSKTQQNQFTGDSVFTISVDIKLSNGNIVTEVFTVTNSENYNNSGYTYYEYTRINWIENTKGLVFKLVYEEPIIEEPTTEEPTTEEITTEEITTEEPTTEEPTTEEPTTEEPTTEEITTEEIVTEEIETNEIPLDDGEEEEVTSVEEPTTEEEVVTEEIETNEIPLDNGEEELEELEDIEIPLDNGVKTGDNTSPIIYIVLMVVVVAIGGAVLILGRKKDSKEDNK